MPTRPHFLVIDDNADSRFLLVKTLLRKFPGALIQECQSAESALAISRHDALAAIIVHRSTEMAGITLVRELRAISKQLPIVMVSSIDRRAAAAGAGASVFLLYDEWLRIGTVVASLIGVDSPDTAPPFTNSRPKAGMEPAAE